MATSATISGETLPIAVIGAGATGLSAAHALVKAGRRVRVFEKSLRCGGAVGSDRIGDWLVERGPNSFQENHRDVVALLGELGLAGERLVAAPVGKNRYIVRDGRLAALPSSPGTFFSTPLFSAGTKLRILLEPLRRPRRRAGDLGLAAFVEDHFGREVVDYAVNPFVSGIYAGDPAKLSTQHAFPKLWESERAKGSLIRGMISQAKSRRAEGHPRTSIISFKDGLQSLTDALAASLPEGSLELGCEVESLLPGKPWRLVWSRSGEIRTETFGAIILALPAGALAGLAFGPFSERPLAALEAVEYSPVTSLFLGFRREQVRHSLAGFGALVPATEKRDILGVIFSSSLFPGRAPADHVAITVMSGGALRPELGRGTPEEIQRSSLADASRLLGIEGAPVFHRLTQWPRAIPQYQLGYERFLESIGQCEKNHPGVYIAGQVRDGISLPNSLLAGMNAASRAVKFSSSTEVEGAR